MGKGWKRVNLPEVLTDYIDKLSKRENIPRWRIIARALSLYAANQDDFERRFWYVFKLLNGWCYVKVAIDLYNRNIVPELYVKEQIAKYLKTLNQIQYRLHLRTGHIRLLTKKLVKLMQEPSQWRIKNKAIAEINDELKDLMRVVLLGNLEMIKETLE